MCRKVKQPIINSNLACDSQNTSKQSVSYWLMHSLWAIPPSPTPHRLGSFNFNSIKCPWKGLFFFLIKCLLVIKFRGCWMIILMEFLAYERRSVWGRAHRRARARMCAGNSFAPFHCQMNKGTDAFYHQRLRKHTLLEGKFCIVNENYPHALCI